MKKIEPRNLKGFRDFLPREAKKRQYVIEVLKSVFESYGFEPLETPALEYEEILSGKYGEEGDRLMYKFVDRGGRNIAMRYDQTVPLARVVAQYGSTGSPQELPMPFKRYQIQPVWRAENTQKGRFREFLQCDADIVGTESLLADAEVIALAVKTLEQLRFPDFKVLINDRKNLSVTFNEKLTEEQFIRVIRAIDKFKKIGRENVIEEISTIGVSKEDSENILKDLEGREKSENLVTLFDYLSKMGVDKNKVEYYPTLARGLDYYTGTIFEIEIEGYTAGSVCGGGRYDNLIGIFSGRDIPAVGFAFGFDRVLDAMEQFNLFPENVKSSVTEVLVTVFPASTQGGSEDLLEKSIEVSSRLRSNNINNEVWLGQLGKLDKQIKFADKKGIKYVVILGPEEMQKNVITVKNLKSGEQRVMEMEKLANFSFE